MALNLTLLGDRKFHILKLKYQLLGFFSFFYLQHSPVEVDCRNGIVRESSTKSKGVLTSENRCMKSLADLL